MKLSSPFIIAPNLAPGLRIGGAWITLEYSDRPGRDGRTRYRWTWIPDTGKTLSRDDLSSGCGGGTLQQGFGDLLSFLGAFAESTLDKIPPHVLHTTPK